MKVVPPVSLGSAEGQTAKPDSVWHRARRWINRRSWFVFTMSRTVAAALTDPDYVAMMVSLNWRSCISRGRGSSLARLFLRGLCREPHHAPTRHRSEPKDVDFVLARCAFRVVDMCQQTSRVVP